MTDHSNLLDALAKPPPPPSELDELIQRDPLELSAADIDAIIAMQRQFRARKESAPRTRAKKVPANGPAPSLDLAALGLIPAPKSAPAIKSDLPQTVSNFRRRI